ncbi:hypothetical protein A2U01_0102356, partial [Trifolium medium]|nr:hypothetical protein [Trifolium medium]
LNVSDKWCWMGAHVDSYTVKEAYAPLSLSEDVKEEVFNTNAII